MDQLEIKIIDQSFVLKRNFRGLMLFEQIAGKPANEMEDNITDIVKLFYCFLKGGNPTSFNYEFEEFINVIDDHPEIFTDFFEFVQNVDKKRGSNYTPPKKPRKK